MEGNICQNCTYYLLGQLLNTPQLFGMAVLLMILKSLKMYSYLQLELLLLFHIFTSRESLYAETGWQTYFINFDYFIPTCRIELFKKSLVPDSIGLWYLLKAEARETILINSFCKNVSVEIINQPSYNAFGKRFINIIHTKLRHKCILHYHYDLYKRISQILHFVEDVYHFCFCM